MQCMHAPRRGRCKVVPGSRGRSFLPPQSVLPLQACAGFGIGAPRQRVRFCGKSYTKVVAMPAASLRHLQALGISVTSVTGKRYFRY